MAQNVLNSEEAELDVCISRLHDTIKQELASIGSDAPDAENPRSLQARIQTNMTQLRAKMRNLELLADEQKTLEEGEAVVAVVNRRKRQYQELQKDFREASLEVKVQRRAARAAVDDRKALLGSANPLQRAQQLKTQADLANSATDTTASLQRTRQLMAEELDHTSATLAALEVSSSTLKGAADEYGQQRGRIKKSHTLLGTMRRASLWDRLTLWGGAALFAAVVAFIVYKRLAYFVPAALVPNFGALVPGMPAFGLANLTAGFGSLWSPAASPAAKVDVDRLPEDDPRMQQWQQWAGTSRSAEDAGPARGRDSGDRDLGDANAAYRAGDSTENYADQGVPAYVEPAVRYAEQLSAAASQPGQEAASAHPQYGGFDGMHSGAMVGAPQNNSAPGPAAAQAQAVDEVAVNASQPTDSVPVMPVNASQPAGGVPVNAPAEQQDLDGLSAEEVAGDAAAEEEVTPEEAKVPVPAPESALDEGNVTAVGEDEPVVEEEVAVEPAQESRREAASSGDKAAADDAVEAGEGLSSTLDVPEATEQEEAVSPVDGEELPAAEAELEGLPQDILGGEAEEAEIAHRHAAPHFAEEASTPKAVEEAVDSADEQAAEPADEAVGEQPPPEQASQEELMLLEELVAATPGLDTVTATHVSDELQDKPAGSAAEDKAPVMEALEQNGSDEAEAVAGDQVGDLDEEVGPGDGEQNVTGCGGSGVQQRVKVEDPVIESRDGLDASALFQRLSREGHQAAQQGESLTDVAAGSGDEALLDTEMDSGAGGNLTLVGAPGVKDEGSAAKEAPSTDLPESHDESDVGNSIHNEL